MKWFSKTESGTLAGKSWACDTQVGDTGVDIFKDFDPLNCLDTLIACPQIRFLTKPGTPPHTFSHCDDWFRLSTWQALESAERHTLWMSLWGHFQERTILLQSGWPRHTVAAAAALLILYWHQNLGPSSRWTNGQWLSRNPPGLEHQIGNAEAFSFMQLLGFGLSSMQAASVSRAK